MKPKFLDFPTQGISCPVCGEFSNYVGCSVHEGLYPTLEKKDTVIRIPNCENCFIECPSCEKDRTVTKYLKLYERAVKQSKTKKLIPKTQKISVKTSTTDVFEDVDLRAIKELDYYRTTTFETLELLFCFDIGSQFGVRDIENKLIDMGIDIPVNFGTIRKTNNKISSLLYTLLMIRATGLSSYEKQIMESEIAKLYEPKRTKKEIVEELKQLIGVKK